MICTALLPLPLVVGEECRGVYLLKNNAVQTVSFLISSEIYCVCVKTLLSLVFVIPYCWMIECYLTLKLQYIIK